MTATRKRQVLTAGLIAFALWPLVQIALVHRFGVSPWKLAGWGMYSTPRIAPGIGVLVQRGEEEPAPMTDVPADVLTACAEYAPKRLWLRDLAPPDAIGALILARLPAYERVTITIYQPVLDTETGMVRTEAETYSYQR